MDRPFEGLKGLFMGRMDRFGYGIDPFGETIGPPEEEIGPFRDAKDRLGEKIDSFRKIRIISVKKGSIMKENNQMSWGVINFWGRILGRRGVLQYAPTTRVAPPPGSPVWQRGYGEHIVRNREEL